MYSPQHWASFEQELLKIAGEKAAMPNFYSTGVNKALMNAGSMAALGGTAGAGVGALAGAVKGYRDARQQGETGLRAVGGGVSGALGGAGKGALVGAGVGGLVGAGHSLVRPEHAEALRQRLTESSAISRFGQRQMHGITGAVNPDGLKGLHMDAESRLKELQALRVQPDRAPNWWQKNVQGKIRVQPTGDELASARESFEAADRAQAHGLTSLPGIVSSLKNRGVKETFRDAKDFQLRGASNASKALTVAGLGMSAHDAIKRQEGETGAEHAARAGIGVLGTGVGVLTGGIPQALQLGVGHAVSSLSPAAGKAIRRAQGPHNTAI